MCFLGLCCIHVYMYMCVLANQPLLVNYSVTGVVVKDFLNNDLLYCPLYYSHADLVAGLEFAIKRGISKDIEEQYKYALFMQKSECAGMCVYVCLCENKGIYWLLNDLCTLCNVIIDNFVLINSVQLYHIPGALLF